MENIEDIRANAEKLAAAYVGDGKPFDWFDALYTEAEGDHLHIPWADLEPNRFLVAHAEDRKLSGRGRKALVIGCGLGDDAKYLYDLGFRVTAFDISPKAVEWARKIHAGTEIEFHVCDVFDTPPQWAAAFDFVLEVYTIQAMPPDFRERSIDAIGDFVKPNGELLVVTRGRLESEPMDSVPWPLSRKDLSRFEANGFVLRFFKELFGDEDEPVRRYVAEYKYEEARTE